MGFLDYDVEIRKIICSTNPRVTQRPLPTRRASQRPLPDRTSCAQVPLPRHPLAGPTGRGQARWVARCVYDHRDHLRKTVPRTSRKEVHRHNGTHHVDQTDTGGQRRRPPAHRPDPSVEPVTVQRRP